MRSVRLGIAAAEGGAYGYVQREVPADTPDAIELP
jgi:hypothetical protein